ncbi:hybrid sensor histidine kinase/response regulator, partial [Campylobacter coli]|nr:hybrid sensor histidine kinase/response regulator [Campylobacter coli]ECQ5515086.1 hybrid sensor histidine kinase/response regulator [Campylobacter coli]EGM5426913.1 hybrid sensor histidine kinase/response regulator [Campylobacter coli]EHN8275099.1 Hpt domain-containing protein [Campylobacter coli]EHY9447557.1 Hpt domain-containing protein [Campylobacter coli]
MEDMQEILEDFLVEAFELVEQIDHDLVELETNPEDLELLNRIFRVAHTVKGSSSFLNFDVLTKLTHHMEDVLNKARHGELKITPDIMDVVLESIDRMKTLLNSIRDNGNDTAIGMDIEPICARLTAISEGESPNGVENETPVEAPQKEEPAPTPEPEVDVNQLSDSEVEAEIERLLKARKAEDQARRAQKKQNTAASTTSKPAASTPKAENMEKKVPASGGGGGGMDQTIRVEVKRLDHLMNLIGELVLGKNRLLK